MSWPRIYLTTAKSNNMGRDLTGMMDCRGVHIRRNDILSVIHDSEENRPREFQYRIEWSHEHAAYGKFNAAGAFMGYLGDVKKDPNFIRSKVQFDPASERMFTVFQQGRFVDDFAGITKKF